MCLALRIENERVSINAIDLKHIPRFAAISIDSDGHVDQAAIFQQSTRDGFRTFNYTCRPGKKIAGEWKLPELVLNSRLNFNRLMVNRDMLIRAEGNTIE